MKSVRDSTMRRKEEHPKIDEIQPPAEEEPSTATREQGLVLSAQGVVVCGTIKSPGRPEFSTPAHQNILTDREIEERVLVRGTKHERAEVTAGQASE